MMNKERFDWIISGLDWDELTESELKLIESFESYMKRKGYLTDAQEPIMEKIYREKSK